MEVVCARCNLIMRKIDIGRQVSYYDPTDLMVQIHRGDLFECPKCGAMVYSSFGSPYLSDNKDNTVFVSRR
ncbi:MAG: hypothetical protein ACTSQY_00425 [Candidatus Odinarchaeia archaeon]|nr:MAG: hypothetical protein [Lokiarchaeota virus Fenrir Meg22_1012]URC17266.1 MAG: hypothetical protein [Lokiarchaeota virus Fenrir Meg22_1214]